MTERPELSLQMREIKSEEWFHERRSSGWMEISQQTRGKGIGWRTSFAGEEMGYAIPTNSRNRFTVDQFPNALFASDKLIPINASSQFCRSICTDTVTEEDHYWISHTRCAHFFTRWFVRVICGQFHAPMSNFARNMWYFTVKITINHDENKFHSKMGRTWKWKKDGKHALNSTAIRNYGMSDSRKIKDLQFYFCIKL